ncbi:MAG: hypothetical protein IPJ97_07145 [Proteobacteria bacterium]|nr:hypothetical protein [Pseudomonadota bacterium]
MARVNWWASNRWRASIGYGNIDLDCFGVTSNTKTLLTRPQWIHWELNDARRGEPCRN